MSQTSHPTASIPELDISDIIAAAVQERREYLKNKARRAEIEDQIKALRQELESLPSFDGFFVPSWRTDLSDRVEAAILKAEQTESKPD